MPAVVHADAVPSPFRRESRVSWRSVPGRWGSWLLAMLCAALLLVGGLGVVADPAGAVELLTDYPVVTVSRGSTASFEIVVASPRAERVALAVIEAPPGWGTLLRGGGFVVNGIYTRGGAGPDGSPKLTLDVRVPADAPPGRKRVVVRGIGPSGPSDLLVELDVADEVPGEVELATDFPSLRGAADTTFRFDLTLRNGGSQQQVFNLSGEGPDGWKVDARPSSQAQAATVTVEPGATAMVQVEADPPDGVAAGKYPIGVKATNKTQTVERGLTAEVTGKVDFKLATASERLNARGKAGGTTRVTLVVANAGTAAVSGIRLSATPPSGWKVTFDPPVVPTIAARRTATVTANIRPSGNAVAGDYSVSLSATGGGTTKDLDVRLAVGTSGWWGAAGLGVIGIALGALLWVFRRFGRR